MSLSSYPKVLKYAVDDRPFILASGKLFRDTYGSDNFKNGRTDGWIQRVKVTGWRSEVYDTVGDGSGTAVQENFYTVKNIIGYTPDNATVPWTELYDIIEYELPERKLFSSKNHLLSVIKGKYLNSAFGSLTDNAYLIFSKMGMIDEAISNGDWCDWAGMNFKNFDFTIDGEEVLFNTTWVGDPGAQTEYTGGEPGGTKCLILDNCTFQGASMPTGLTTRSAMRSLCFSYDKLTTIDFNGVALDPALD